MAMTKASKDAKKVGKPKKSAKATSKVKKPVAKVKKTPTKKSPKVVKKSSVGKVKAKPATKKKSTPKKKAVDTLFVVEAILEHQEKSKNGKKYFRYLVKWEDYGEEDNTWEPEESFTESTLVEEYWASVPGGRPDL